MLCRGRSPDRHKVVCEANPTFLHPCYQEPLNSVFSRHSRSDRFPESGHLPPVVPPKSLWTAFSTGNTAFPARGTDLRHKWPVFAAVMTRCNKADIQNLLPEHAFRQHLQPDDSPSSSKAHRFWHPGMHPQRHTPVKSTGIGQQKQGSSGPPIGISSAEFARRLQPPPDFELGSSSSSSESATNSCPPSDPACSSGSGFIVSKATLCPGNHNGSTCLRWKSRAMCS